MRKVSRSALVPYSAAQMFSLVSDVEAYPEFLPWCSDAVVHSHKGDVVEGTLEMQRVGLKQRFRTRNILLENESIDMGLVDGPFKRLSGGWRFQELGDAGSKVSLELEFEFESRLADGLMGPFFEEICNSLVGAFVQRADALYGRRQS